MRALTFMRALSGTYTPPGARMCTQVLIYYCRAADAATSLRTSQHKVAVLGATPRPAPVSPVLSSAQSSSSSSSSSPTVSCAKVEADADNADAPQPLTSEQCTQLFAAYYQLHLYATHVTPAHAAAGAEHLKAIHAQLQSAALTAVKNAVAQQLEKCTAHRERRRQVQAQAQRQREQRYRDSLVRDQQVVGGDTGTYAGPWCCGWLCDADHEFALRVYRAQTWASGDSVPATAARLVALGSSV